MTRASSDRLVVLMGADGRLGSRLAFRVAAAGGRQRLLVTGRGATPRLPDGAPLPETEVVTVPAELTDGSPETTSRVLAGAFAGAHAVFLVPSAVRASRLPLQRAAVDAAVLAGVRHVVHVSSVGAGPDAVSAVARDDWLTEQYLRGTDLSWTVLRASVFHRTLTFAVHTEASGADGAGVLQAPAGDGRVASVSHDDVADVATAVLLDEDQGRHTRRTYHLTGPEALAFDEVAAALAEATGRPIRYVPQTVEQARALFYRSTSAEVEDWITLCQAIERGDLARVSPDVGHLAGRRARSLADWLDDYPAEWAHLRLPSVR
ncbi:NmrA family NAD(P)-binding protein [Promicromonospora citrea]|uniref:NmrA family transcriptional regulator n=1 Tax=Promicromonospora citrea TaxID=43677 RepID=A0A8H9L291_9MICO|nr:NmrA family NAD(P)-binding protein [Promicromonospora citrea]NNH50708.1 NAD(P)H-binding protein [Promicromonospora citrea]GGM11731.1 NmrA family transcriptional regulator [Promicromonospora citrea]